MLLFVSAGLAQTAPPVATPEPVDLQMVTRIRQEGFRNSQVMDHARQLTDVFGARLTGSESLKRSQEWAAAQFTAWGLANARQEPYQFGRGWSFQRCSVRMVAPDTVVLHALPKAWTPGTNGVVRGQVVKAKIATSADLERYRGKLAGKIVLLGDPREVKPGEKPALSRFSEKELADLYAYGIPRLRSDSDREAYARMLAFRKAVNQFLAEEKALALVEGSRGDGGLIFVQGGGSQKPGEPIGVPSVVLGIEQYGRLARLADRDLPVELEIDVAAQFHEQDQNAYNTVAEIPGSDKSAEVVMVGAHIDSWHGSTGATDDAAGVAAIMEAVRILKALGVQPRRTIRIALWTGEEQGLLGSRAWVAHNLGSRPEPEDPAERAKPFFLRKQQGPFHLQPGHGKLAAYFNLDNGTGKIRGVYAEENSAVVPIFSAWLAPFRDLGADTITMRVETGTDHVPFDQAGIPAFQFVQDEVEYNTLTHHSAVDSFERLQREDLMQASVIMASFLYHAAMRDEMLPRKPLPVGAVPAPGTEPTKAAPAKGKKK